MDKWKNETLQSKKGTTFQRLPLQSHKIENIECSDNAHEVFLRQQ